MLVDSRQDDGQTDSRNKTVVRMKRAVWAHEAD